MSAALDFDDAVLGQGLPPGAEAALQEAGRLRAARDVASDAMDAATQWNDIPHDHGRPGAARTWLTSTATTT